MVVGRLKNPSKHCDQNPKPLAIITELLFYRIPRINATGQTDVCPSSSFRVLCRYIMEIDVYFDAGVEMKKIDHRNISLPHFSETLS